jgi:predicted AAA+ superfamily ATPase
LLFQAKFAQRGGGLIAHTKKMQKQSIKLLDINKANLLKLATWSKVMCHFLQREILFVTDNLLSPIAKKSYLHT